MPPRIANLLHPHYTPPQLNTYPPSPISHPQCHATMGNEWRPLQPPCSWCVICGIINGQAKPTLVSMWVSIYTMATLIPILYPNWCPIRLTIMHCATQICSPFMGMSIEWYATSTRVVITLKTLEVTKTSDTTLSPSTSLGQLQLSPIFNPNSYWGWCNEKLLPCKVDLDIISSSGGLPSCHCYLGCLRGGCILCISMWWL